MRHLFINLYLVQRVCLMTLLLWCLGLYPDHISAFAQATNTTASAADSALELAWFYKPPTDGTPITTLASEANRFILTMNDEGVRDQLKSLNIETPILQYVRFDAIEDPCQKKCPCTKPPWNNQAAWKAGDFCTIQFNHPDWFLKTQGGNLIESWSDNQRHVWMDPGSQGWRDFWLSRVKEAQETRNWEGVFLDNVQASLGPFEQDQIILNKYHDDVSFQNAVKGFLDYIQKAYFIPQRRPLEGNIIFLPWQQPKATWMSFISSMNGGMLEDFAVGWVSGSYKTSSQWLTQIETVEDSQNMGKRVTLVAQGDHYDYDRQAFALASYLLANQGSASYRYSDSQGEYEHFWWYDSFTQARKLGKPTTDRYQNANGSWVREFEFGQVIVDPVNHRSNITLQSVSPEGKTPLHVSALKIWYTDAYQVSTEVRVKNASNGYPPPYTQVALSTRLPNGSISLSIGTVDEYGIVSFSLKSPLKGTYTSTVTNVKGPNVRFETGPLVSNAVSKTID